MPSTRSATRYEAASGGVFSARWRALLLAPLALAAGGCTSEPGGWFGVLSPSLSAGYVARPDRDAGEGWQRLSNDYQVQVRSARLELEAIRLLAAAAGAAGRFDPARPPPGYTLCHGGHCHSTDGRLVPYAEIEAQLGGGQGGGLAPAVSLVGSGALDLLMPGEQPLACAPGCNLDRTRILRAVAPVLMLTMKGTVRDGRQPPRIAPTPFRWQLLGGGDAGAAGATLEAELDLPLDRRHPPLVALGLQVRLGAALFDGVDFAALAPVADTLDLAPAESRLRSNLTEGTFLTATVARREE